MDVETAYGNQHENEPISRRNRIQLYKNILNLYRGRLLTLESILASKQTNINVTPAKKTHEELCKCIQGLHDDIVLIQSIKNSLNLIKLSLTCTEIMSLIEINSRGGIKEKIEGIIYFSKSIMRMYNESFSEISLVEKMKNYSSVLTEYMKSLDSLREKEKHRDDYSKEMEKVELQVYRINLMRAMKSILIGYISLNCPSLLRNVQAFRSPLRRDLSVEDFRDTWKIGLTS